MTNKDNEMICTGAIPPQLIMGMEWYQTYLAGMMNWCQLYANLTGYDQWVTYWSQFRPKE